MRRPGTPRPASLRRTPLDARADPPTVQFPGPDAATVRLAAPSAQTVPLGPVGAGDAGLSDSIALSLSSVLGSVAGLISWVLAARLVEPAAVGAASQLVAAFILVAGAAQLNLGAFLLRWIPRTGRHTGRLVWRAMAVIMPLAAVLAAIYAFVLPDLGRTAAGSGPFGLGVVLFVLATTGWSVFVVHDFVLVAAGKPWWAVWRNAVFAVVRLGLLAALVLFGLGAQGIVLSWVGPIVVWIVVGSFVLVALLRRVDRAAPGGRLPHRREVVGFVGPTAVAELGTVLLYNQVTVLVTARFGDVTGAKFFLVWQAVMVVDITAKFFMNSLSVGVAREPHRTAELAAAARRRILMIFLPMLAVGALLAGPALDIIFGPAYAEAADILRLLLLGLAFRLVVLHELGVRQAVGEAMRYARLQLVSTVLVIAVVAVVPIGDGSVTALAPVALGYIAVQVACAAVVLLAPASRRRTNREVPTS